MAQLAYGTAMTVGFEGMKASSVEDDCMTAYNAEVSAEIPFGVAVAMGTTEDAAIKLVDANSKIKGVVVHSHNHSKGIDLGDTGLLPKASFAVMKKGEIWVKVEETVAVGDPVFVRHTASGGNTRKGAFRKSADTATAIAMANSFYRTAASAGGLAKVFVNI